MFVLYLQRSYYYCTIKPLTSFTWHIHFAMDEDILLEMKSRITLLEKNILKVRIFFLSLRSLLCYKLIQKRVKRADCPGGNGENKYVVLIIYYGFCISRKIWFQHLQSPNLHASGVQCCIKPVCQCQQQQ